MFCSKKWVAKLWRSVCGVTGLVISAMRAAAWTARLSWRVVRWLSGLLPGKQPDPRPRDAPPVTQEIEQLRREHSEAILAPLALLDLGSACAWNRCRDIFSDTTSDTRRPAP